MKPLFIIPARGGSKGIPRKNIKLLGGKPLILHTIDVARQLTTDDNICVTTDDKEIIEVVEAYNLKVPFVRPAELATDTASSNDVIRHAINFYPKASYDCVVLLQPTSPFKTAQHVKGAMAMYTPDIDMIVSVKETDANPYYVLFEKDEKGFLKRSKTTTGNKVVSRQTAPRVYQYNGAVYVFGIPSFQKAGEISAFTKLIAYEMDDLHSVDLDTPLDWAFAEFLLEKGYFSF